MKVLCSVIVLFFCTVCFCGHVKKKFRDYYRVDPFRNEHELKEKLLAKYWNEDFLGKNVTYFEYCGDALICPPPSDVQYLRYFDPNLEYILGDFFENYINITSLNLGTNKNLRDISSEAFKNLGKLKKLDLSFCDLSDLPATVFSSQKHLISLNLMENHFWYFEHEVFDPLQSLEILDLSQNELRSLSSRWFRRLNRLKVLNLKFNQIQTFNCFINSSVLLNLKLLAISHNLIEENGEDCFYKYNCLPSLEILEAERILFNSIKKSFIFTADAKPKQNLMCKCQLQINQLQYLQLKQNAIKSIANNTFELSKNLLGLDLSHNKLNHLPENVFTVLTELQYLSLAQNKLTTLPWNLGFDIESKLSALNLCGNKIQELTEKTFSHLGSLKQLWIGQNQITNIANRTFDPLKNLSALEIGGNNFSKSISSILSRLVSLEELWLERFNVAFNENFDSFDNLVNLRILDLSRSNITDFRFAGKNYVHIFLLFLQNNKLEILLQDTFISFRALRYLNLERNSISEIDSKTFQPLRNLLFLSLAFNQLEELPENIFENLKNLLVLSLISNQLRDINPVAGFEHLRSIREIYLNNNKIKHLESNIFEKLPKLNTLSVEKNLIEIIDPMSFAFSKISRLYLSGNRLTFLNTTQFRYTKIKSISIQNNPWQCQCFIEIIRAMKYFEIAYFIGSTDITHGPSSVTMTFADFDRSLLDEDKEIVSCIYTNSTKCQHDTSLSEKLYKQFTTILGTKKHESNQSIDSKFFPTLEELNMSLKNIELGQGL